MDSKTEKRIEKQLDKAERQHDKAVLQEAKGHTASAEKHENRAMALENKASMYAQGNNGGHYSGLNYPMTGATAHPMYGYHRLPRDKKAERLEAKAVSWESRGNTVKAQKNRDKALRHRQRMQPGYVPIAHPQPYYVDKANRLDARAMRYQQMGLMTQANRCQQRALRCRNKHGVTGMMGTGMTGMTGMTGTTVMTGMTGTGMTGTGMTGTGMTGTGMTGTGMTGTGMTGTGMTGTGMTGTGMGMMGGNNTYSGLNYPYTGATMGAGGNKRLTSAQKAQRYEQKAAAWEKRGNMSKAQKNREKALRYSQMGQAGYVRPTRQQEYYVDRAARMDQKAMRARQMGRNDRAMRYQQKAQRIRSKHNASVGTGMAGNNMAGNTGMGMGGNTMGTGMTGNTMGTGMGANTMGTGMGGNTMGTGMGMGGMNQNIGSIGQGTYPMGTQMGPVRYMGTNYQGLNFPYAGAATHPQYGYQRLPHNKKAERFELKAAEWESRGNMKKAQKNREKALRYRNRGQPGYVAPVRNQDYYVNRANLYDQRAVQYSQWGMTPQAQRYQGRSQRIRAKHNVPMTGMTGAGMAPMTGAGVVGAGMTPMTTGTTAMPMTTSGVPMTTGTQYGGFRPGQYNTTYQGLNFPYAGAATHPQYGYQRLPYNKKAERFELKAAEWERRGNMKKAQKNRNKALRYRSRDQPGYAAPVRANDYYVTRANAFDQRAMQYQQWGMMPQAQRYQGRAQRVRAKHNVPMTGSYPMRPSYQYATSYQGLNYPYTGATAHPQYGYQRLAPNAKAERFEMKAAEWERRGYTQQALKNREKAQRARARSQPGYVAPVRQQSYYVDRANLYDQKATQYQQWGMMPQSTRYQQRARRVRTKHNVPAQQTTMMAGQPMMTTQPMVM